MPPVTMLADLWLRDLAIPADPFAIPASGVDAGVLPFDMADHLRAATLFPVAPTVTGSLAPLQVIGGGRCVWAAARAGWEGSIRCVVRGPGPAAIFTFPLDHVPGESVSPPELVHTAAFVRELLADERAEVGDRFAALAERMSAAGLVTFARVCDLRWPRANLLHLSATAGAGETSVVGVELWALFDGLRRDGISLRAWDGRVLL